MRSEFKKLFAALALVLTAGCAVENPGTPPPIDQFAFPVSVVFSQPGVDQPPVLYVVNSNFDLRFNSGWVTAVDLSRIDLARFTQGTGVVLVPLTGVVSAENVALVDSFGGKPGVFRPSASSPNLRLFVPTRSDHRLFVLEASGARLACHEPVSSSPQNCASQGISLVVNDTLGTFDPFSAELQGNRVFVAPLRRAIAPGASSGIAFLSMLDANAPAAPSFVSIGDAPSEDLLETPAGLYVTGRSISVGGTSQALRFFPPGSETVQSAGVTDATRIQESRGLGVSTDGTRLFVATRGPDASAARGQGPDGLLVVDISLDPATGKPANRILGFTPLPLGPSSVVVLPRPGRRDLVGIACSTGQAVVFYDDDLGEVVASVNSAEPAGLAQGPRPGGGRLVFVATFGANTVDVIDLPNTDDPALPTAARLAGRIGAVAQ